MQSAAKDAAAQSSARAADEVGAARRRLAAARRWVESSAAMLERARTQVALSREELRSAEEYLDRLERAAGTKGLRVDTSFDGEDGAKNGSSAFGEIERETGPSSDAAPQSETTAVTSNLAAAGARLVAKLSGECTEKDDDIAGGMEVGTSPSTRSRETTPRKSNSAAGRTRRIVKDSDDRVVSADDSSEKVQPVENSMGERMTTRVSTSDTPSNATPQNQNEIESVRNEDSATTRKKEDDSCSDDESYSEFLSLISNISDASLEKRSKANHVGGKMIKNEADSTIIAASQKESKAEDGRAKPIRIRKRAETIRGANAVEVTQCGIPEVNGTYHRFGTHDNNWVPSYSKIAKYDGKEAMFTICRWQSNNGTRKWYITATIPNRGRQLAFYVAYAPTASLYDGDRPPRDGWMALADGDELFLSPAYKCRGIEPVPIVVVPDPCDTSSVDVSRRSLAERISNAMSTGRSVGTKSCTGMRSRGSRASLQSIGSISTKMSGKDDENVPPSVYLPPSLLH